MAGAMPREGRASAEWVVAPTPAGPSGTLPALVWAEDAAGNTVFLNGQAQSLVGPNRPGNRVAAWEALLHPEDRTRYRERVLAARAGLKPFLAENRLRLPDGSYHWFLESGVPTFDLHGEFTGFAGASVDVHHNKIAAAATDGLEGRCITLASGLPQVLYLAESDRSRFHYVSPAFESLWGRPTAELYANPRTWCEGIHPEDRSRFAVEMTITEPAETRHLEYRVVRPDGTMTWVLDQARSLPEASGSTVRIAGLVQDISDRRDLELKLLAAAEEERQRIGQDLHDGLCQNLTGLALLCKALEHRLAPVSATLAVEIAKVGDLLGETIGRARELVRGLYPATLNLAGLPGALVELAVGTERTLAVPVQFHMEGKRPSLAEGEALQLFRIVQEAVHNAVRHGRPTRIVLHLSAQPTGIRLRVHDDGRGLPDGVDQCRGMGLRTMRRRAAAIGASLQIRRAPEGGTEIVCSLPYSPDRRPEE